jgi:hypothetical protein
MKERLRLRESLRRVIGLEDDDSDHDDSISVGELLVLGREEKGTIDRMEALGTIRPRSRTEARVLRALNNIPNDVGIHSGNSATVESLRHFSTQRQSLYLLSDKSCAEDLWRAGKLALHIPPLRTTREMREWLADMALVVSGLYVLVNNIGASIWPAMGLALARRGSIDTFIAYWPSRLSTVTTSLESALKRAISCSLVPTHDHVKDLEDPEALALLLVDRFADDLVKDPRFVRRIARFAAPRSRAFKQALFECLALHDLANDQMAMALGHAEQIFARRKFGKAVQTALSV